MAKKLEIFIRDEALDAVKEALQSIGIVGMNVHEVRGHGRQGGIELSWRGTSYQMDLLPKMQVNIVLSDHVGWYSEESQVELKRKAAVNVTLVLSGKPPLFQVNAQASR